MAMQFLPALRAFIAGNRQVKSCMRWTWTPHEWDWERNRKCFRLFYIEEETIYLQCVGVIYSWCLVRGVWMPPHCTHTHYLFYSFLWDSSPPCNLLAREYGSSDSRPCWAQLSIAYIWPHETKTYSQRALVLQAFHFRKDIQFQSVFTYLL